MSVDIRTTIRDESASMNLANGNFAHLMGALGYDTQEFEWGGTFDPQDVCERVARLLRQLDCQPAEFERSTTDEIGEHGCRCISFGVDSDRVRRYCNQLLIVAARAIALGGQIEWC